MKIGSHEIDIKNPGKVFFLDYNITKGDVINYYDKIADRLLPYLQERPLTLSRFPDGLAGEGFYQKEVPDYFPDWIDTISDHSGVVYAPQERSIGEMARKLSFVARVITEEEMCRHVEYI